MKTTQEIYEQMRDQMAQRSGCAPDDGCELAVRLYAAAAQIESLYAYADWSRRQCFPQSAAVEYLDMHAQNHGLTRDPAKCARGTLIIGIDRALDFALTIPEPRLPMRDQMSAAEFDQMMATGLAQAKADDSFDVDEVFGELEAGLED